MAELGVMIEAQEGLTWKLWRAIAETADRLGFAALRTSDHCQSVMGVDRPSLSAWPALNLAADWTHRIQLGTMVSPLTFYQPAVLARIARAADELSGGRVILGVGAGWNEAEHERFGIPLPPWSERFHNLEAGVERIRQTLQDHPLPLLIGGGGERRTLPLAARVAAEWNLHTTDAGLVAAKSAVLAERCRDISRDPAEIRRSVMTGCLLGRDRSELRTRAERLSRILPSLAGLPPDEVLEAYAEKALVGTPAEIVEQVRPLAAAGVQLFMFQHFLLDDSEALELMASEVAPAIASF
ncbi:MAG: LLM class flavin-dependent oxidoreductase [Candidatus Dormibacteraeota bacterium]|nr:LLM class flavin-dependent oxidoreductase [Candidatus Dormibacteraeota bacterium]